MLISIICGNDANAANNFLSPTTWTYNRSLNMFQNFHHPDHQGGNLIYFRHVNDAFAVFEDKSNSIQFLKQLNLLHQFLVFTHEEEVNGKLPILDVFVEKINPKNFFYFAIALYICIIHVYSPFARKGIVSRYSGRDVRTRLEVAIFEAYGPPVCHIKVGASR